jgi:DNA-binding NarL/FixJ family response regulator
MQRVSAMNNISTKIIIADDHRMMREGLRSMLEKHSGLKTVAESGNGRDTVKLVQELLPDVVIMDVSMPDLNGIEATRQIKKDLPGVKVIGLSMHSDGRFVTEMLKAGASGYLLKHCAFEELEHAINAVLANRIYLSPEITGVVLEDYIHNAQNGSKNGKSLNNSLTGREREVLQLLAEGKTTKDIAAHLNLSIKTVETHRQNIMGKTNMHTIAELTKYAIVEGLTTLEKNNRRYSSNA